MRAEASPTPGSRQESSARFLTGDEVVTLTGRKVKKMQIEALLKMGVPFWVNAIGKPVVTVAAVEGQRDAPVEKEWVMPRIVSNGKKKHT